MCTSGLISGSGSVRENTSISISAINNVSQYIHSNFKDSVTSPDYFGRNNTKFAKKFPPAVLFNERR